MSYDFVLEFISEIDFKLLSKALIREVIAFVFCLFLELLRSMDFTELSSGSVDTRTDSYFPFSCASFLGLLNSLNLCSNNKCVVFWSSTSGI